MYIYNLKRQINECFLFANETIWLIDFATGNVLYLGSVVAIYFEVINFLATLAADFNELLLALDTEVSTAYKVGCDACGRGTCKRVKHPPFLSVDARMMRVSKARGFCVGCLPQDFSHGAMAGSRYTSVICFVIFETLHQFVTEDINALLFC